MRLSRITGIVLLLLAGAVAVIAQGVPAQNRNAAYVVAAVIGVIGLWRFFARNGN